MATIRKRKDKWQALVRRQGSRQMAKTFLSRKSAEQWARQTEIRLERGVPDHMADCSFDSFADVVARYALDISRQKRGYRVEYYRLKTISKSCLGGLSPIQIAGPQIARFRDDRLKSAGKATVRRELGLLRHIFEVARREWGLPYHQNPVDHIQKPQPPQGRTRRFCGDEEQRLFKALRGCRNPEVSLMVRLALATAMRRGEILNLNWADIDVENRTALLRETKTGEDRMAPLSSVALEVLREQSVRKGEQERVFSTTASALGQAWLHVVRRAAIDDLRFHDLRHEAISRFFEKGLSVPEVALISGHKTPAMLFRYTHLKPEAVATKLM